MKYRCSICGHVYDEDIEKIPFDSLPSSWVCPLCGAPKDLFEPFEDVKEETLEKKEEVAISEQNIELTPTEIGIILSNFARGSEKQYKKKEQEHFNKLAKYFLDKNTSVDNAKVDDLLVKLKEDINVNYKEAMNSANNDRGTKRALTWSNKVTTMLASILERYQKEGNAIFEGKHIYVCTICGFVYIGDAAPSLCPVCKVPSNKFKEVA